jgi:hypothetical protein
VACVVRWAASAHVREREGRRPARLRAEKRRKGGLAGLEWGRGERVGRFCFFPFQIHFKSFSNPFKFKSFTSFQIQTFTQIFTNYFTIIFKNFDKYFKTFKTTPQPKLMHSNNDAQALIASKLLK